MNAFHKQNFQRVNLVRLRWRSDSHKTSVVAIQQEMANRNELSRQVPSSLFSATVPPPSKCCMFSRPYQFRVPRKGVTEEHPGDTARSWPVDQTSETRWRHPALAQRQFEGRSTWSTCGQSGPLWTLWTIEARDHHDHGACGCMMKLSPALACTCTLLRANARDVTICCIRPGRAWISPKTAKCMAV